jgi:hypothetical protein
MVKPVLGFTAEKQRHRSFGEIPSATSVSLSFKATRGAAVLSLAIRVLVDPVPLLSFGMY